MPDEGIFDSTHLSFLSWFTHPFQVRTTAVLARQQHDASVTLMKRFALTANKILSELFPDFDMAIEENDKELLQDTINMIVEWVQEDIQETKENRER